MKLNVFTYKTEESAYSYNNQIEITNAPKDADWSRWAMLNDGTDFRLYCFKQGTNNTMYQFAFDGSSYHFGHNSQEEVTIDEIPENVNTDAFAMLHDGGHYRLYLGDSKNPNTLHQFAWNGDAYVYAPGSTMQVSGITTSANTNAIAMLHTGTQYGYYALDLKKSALQQAVYNVSENAYVAVNNLSITNIPKTTDMNKCSMVYGQDSYWLYFLEENKNTESLIDKNRFLEQGKNAFKGHTNENDFSEQSINAFED